MPNDFDTEKVDNSKPKTGQTSYQETTKEIKLETTKSNRQNLQRFKLLLTRRKLRKCLTFSNSKKVPSLLTQQDHQKLFLIELTNRFVTHTVELVKSNF